jgi:hypothetical protein
MARVPNLQHFVVFLATGDGTNRTAFKPAQSFGPPTPGQLGLPLKDLSRRPQSACTRWSRASPESCGEARRDRAAASVSGSLEVTLDLAGPMSFRRRASLYRDGPLSAQNVLDYQRIREAR